MIISFGYAILAGICCFLLAKLKNTGGIVLLAVIIGVLMGMSLLTAYQTTKEEVMIIGEGNNYEVIVVAPTPDERTLVYAVDLGDNKGRTDILAEYPMRGYKIEQAGERTFLVPQNTHITFSREGDIVLVSEDGEAFNVPPFSTGGK